MIFAIVYHNDDLIRHKITLSFKQNWHAYTQVFSCEMS